MWGEYDAQERERQRREEEENAARIEALRPYFEAKAKEAEEAYESWDMGLRVDASTDEEGLLGPEDSRGAGASVDTSPEAAVTPTDAPADPHDIPDLEPIPEDELEGGEEAQGPRRDVSDDLPRRGEDASGGKASSVDAERFATFIHNPDSFTEEEQRVIIGSLSVEQRHHLIENLKELERQAVELEKASPTSPSQAEYWHAEAERISRDIQNGDSAWYMYIVVSSYKQNAAQARAAGMVTDAVAATSGIVWDSLTSTAKVWLLALSGIDDPILMRQMCEELGVSPSDMALTLLAPGAGKVVAKTAGKVIKGAKHLSQAGRGSLAKIRKTLKTVEKVEAKGYSAGGVGPRARKHTPASQPQGPAIFKKEGGGGSQKTSATSTDSRSTSRVSANSITPEEFRELGFRGGVIKKGPHVKKDNWLRANSQSQGGVGARKALIEKVKKEFFNEKGRPQVSQIINKDGSTAKQYKYDDGSSITIGRQGSGGCKLQITDTKKQLQEKITFIN